MSGLQNSIALRWLVGVAVCVSAAALTYVVVTGTGRQSHETNHASGGQHAASSPDEAGSEQAAMRRLVEFASARRFGSDERDELLEIIHSSDVLQVTRTGLGAMADLLAREDVDIEQSVREDLKLQLIDSLDDSRSRVRSTALAACRRAGLHHRADVERRIRAMRQDESEHVATIAGHIIDAIENERQGEREGG